MSRHPTTVADAWQADATPESAFAAAVAADDGAAEQAEIEAGMTASVEKSRKSKKKLDDAGTPFGAEAGATA